MSPKEILNKFVEAFNKADVDALANLYSEDAVNHQVAEQPVEGRDAIRQRFIEEFSRAEMTCKLLLQTIGLWANGAKSYRSYMT